MVSATSGLFATPSRVHPPWAGNDEQSWLTGSGAPADLTVARQWRRVAKRALSRYIPRHWSPQRTLMSDIASSVVETRRHQMFPTLESAEIERVRRFGE